MKSLKFIAAGVVAVAAACSSQSSNEYSLTADFPSEMIGKTAYIVDFYQDSVIVDSVLINDSTVTLSGTIEKPIRAILRVDDTPLSEFYLEPSTSYSFGQEGIKGGHLNSVNRKFMDQWREIATEFRMLPESVQVESLPIFQQRLDSLQNKVIEENMENPLGVALFISFNQDLTVAKIDSVRNLYPSLKDDVALEGIRKILVSAEETGEGKKFKDFEVTYNDSTFRLSDVVGKGKYVLVDFWASWCGPCIRQSAVIKEIYKEYGPKGLDVIGVAVWDEPENTLEAIKNHELPWKNVIDARNIPTDLYGIQGIPCIILFGPDGTILSRGKQSEELWSDVRNAMEGGK